MTESIPEPSSTSKSILDTTKKAIGIDPEYDVFDVDIVMHINTYFGVLNQLGVGPAVSFRIEDNIATWDQFQGHAGLDLPMVQTYLATRVRLIFDPPATSFTQESMKKVADEIEWRLHIQAEEAKQT